MTDNKSDEDAHCRADSWIRLRSHRGLYRARPRPDLHPTPIGVTDALTQAVALTVLATCTGTAGRDSHTEPAVLGLGAHPAVVKWVGRGLVLGDDDALLDQNATMVAGKTLLEVEVFTRAAAEQRVTRRDITKISTVNPALTGGRRTSNPPKYQR